VFAQLIAVAPITTAGACHEHKPEGYNSHEDDKRVPHGSQLWHSVVSLKRGNRMKSVTQSTMCSIETNSFVAHY
jgi:hypothetical protein